MTYQSKNTTKKRDHLKLKSLVREPKTSLNIKN